MDGDANSCPGGVTQRGPQWALPPWTRLTGFAHQPGWQQPLLAYALRYSAHVVQEWQQFCEAFDKGMLREQGSQERDEVALA